MSADAPRRVLRAWRGRGMLALERGTVKFHVVVRYEEKLAREPRSTHEDVYRVEAPSASVAVAIVGDRFDELALRTGVSGTRALRSIEIVFGPLPPGVTAWDLDTTDGPVPSPRPDPSPRRDRMGRPTP